MRRRLALSRHLTRVWDPAAENPVLVGVFLVVTVVVALYLAWSGNNRLPFLPTYQLDTELPSAAELVPGAEVRVGGFRVGVVDKLTARAVTLPDGKTTDIAVARLKLDKVIEPLSIDTQVLVRSRSTLGVKYLQLTPGTSPNTYAPGETIPLARASEAPELDNTTEFLTSTPVLPSATPNAFDLATRRAQQQMLASLGTSLTGRGESINQAIAGLAPLFQHLTPVASGLSAPQTGLSQSIAYTGAATAQIAPVSRGLADLFVAMDKATAALSRNPRAVADASHRLPATEDVSVQSLRVGRPFLADSTDLARRLRLSTQALSQSLPLIAAAVAEGTPLLRQSVAASQPVTDVLQATSDLAKNKVTLPALQKGTQLGAVAVPLLEKVAPYQTVCNYFNYTIYPFSEQLSENAGNGTAERVLSMLTNEMQPNDVDQTSATRPADVPADQNPRTATEPNPISPQREALHLQPYGPAVDSNGNADCQTGQWGYLNRLVTGSRYAPSNDPSTGGGHEVVDSSDPFTLGPTFTGLPSLKSVP